jgi:hypothetical protein
MFNHIDNPKNGLVTQAKMLMLLGFSGIIDFNIFQRRVPNTHALLRHLVSMIHTHISYKEDPCMANTAIVASFVMNHGLNANILI